MTGPTSNESRDWFFKYPPVSPDDRKWGIFVLGAGTAHIAPHGRYPPTRHPTGYHITWPRLRVLREFQCVLISNGQGVFETRMTKRQTIKAGDLFMLFPDVWHRYTPDPKTGWDEHWVSFDGDFVRNLLKRGIISPRAPVFETGQDYMVSHCYDRLITLVRSASIGYQPIAGALTLQIIASARAAHIAPRPQDKHTEQMVRQATFHLEQNTDQPVNVREMAGALGVGYSLLRRDFKRLTGLSLKRYHLQLRLNKAKDLLNNTAYTVKQIAGRLNFDTPGYFMKLFKKSTGQTPTKWRNYSRGLKHPQLR